MGHDHNDLKKLYAALLGAPDTTPEASPAFFKTLKQLSPQDVKFLDWLFKRAPMGGFDSPGSARISEAVAAMKAGPAAFLFTLMNLERNALILTSVADQGYMGPVGTPPSGLIQPKSIVEHGHQITVTITAFGIELVRVCAGS
jgi:hypothetical protein